MSELDRQGDFKPIGMAEADFDVMAAQIVDDWINDARAQHMLNQAPAVDEVIASEVPVSQRFWEACGRAYNRCFGVAAAVATVVKVGRVKD